MKNQEAEIKAKLENHLDGIKYKVYKDSFRFFVDYAKINYQSSSIVDFNTPDDNMIYGIGTMIYRIRDGKIFEIHSHANEEKQIIKILSEN